VLFLRDHGRQPGGKMFWNSEIAYKYKMSNMQAALGLAQLERVDELIARKRQIFSWYREFLSDVDGLTLNAEIPGTLNTYWMVTVVLDSALGMTKECLIEIMRAAEIDCRPFFYPLSSLPAYGNIQQARRAQEHNHVSYRLSPYGVNLPSGLQMTAERVARVCGTLKSAIQDRVAAIGGRA
jgi:perosamine synthetase